MADKPPAAPIPRWPTDEEIRTAYDEYVAAVGKVTAAWNYLHEKLGQLFVSLVGAPYRDVTMAVWYSSNSDRAQREMLRAAIGALDDSYWDRLRLPQPHAKDDLEWLLGSANELAPLRNKAVHAQVSLSADDAKAAMVASPASGRRRGEALSGMVLIDEFELVESDAATLSQFAYRADIRLKFASAPWPDRPSLLIEQQKKTRPSRPPRQPRSK